MNLGNYLKHIIRTLIRRIITDGILTSTSMKIGLTMQVSREVCQLYIADRYFMILGRLVERKLTYQSSSPLDSLLTRLNDFVVLTRTLITWIIQTRKEVIAMSKRKNRNKWLKRQLASGKIIKQANGTFISNPDYKVPKGDKIDTKDKTTSLLEFKSHPNDGKWQNYKLVSCAHYPSLVFKLGEIDIYAATKDRLSQVGLKAHDISLVLNTSLASLNVANLVSGSRRFADLNQYAYHIEEVHLNWDDGSSFAGDVNFWRALYKKLVEFDIKAVCFCCLGGHGRTGTAIAALALSVSDAKADDVIDAIRDHYCKEAIETTTQEEYLSELANERNKQYKPDEFNVTLLVYERPKPNPVMDDAVSFLPDMKGEPTTEAEDANRAIIEDLTKEAVDDITKADYQWK